MELLAKVIFSTAISPLWLGLTLCGRNAVIKHIIPFLRHGRPYPYTRPNIDAAAWSSQPQSFTDVLPAESGNGKVTRANVWRLCHDFYALYQDGDNYSGTPFYGWAPFGETKA